jgi:hypothetical protein
MEHMLDDDQHTGENILDQDLGASAKLMFRDVPTL